jgi:hypothetical protein
MSRLSITYTHNKQHGSVDWWQLLFDIDFRHFLSSFLIDSQPNCGRVLRQHLCEHYNTEYVDFRNSRPFKPWMF